MKAINLKLEEELHRQLKTEAIRKGLFMNELAIQAIKELLRNEQR